VIASATARFVRWPWITQNSFWFYKIVVKNDAFLDPNAEYYLQEKRFMFHLFPKGPNKVLDLGCGAGRVGKMLLDSGRAVEVVGVEIFALAAAEARKHYKCVHVGDVEGMTLDYHDCFDVVICGDVLEHLKEPEKVVKEIYRWLKPGGLIVCCVPNIRYWRISRNLILKGDWEYVSQGIMDQTHLRFFTTKSLRRMLNKASFVIEREDMRIANGPKQRAFNRLTFGVFKEFLGFQILMTARKRIALDTSQNSE
jgi:2-polyprenyl-3-methyl-5-hydroxy-6-metoxy-1,4-benzoquinol methylase